jgi:outer membrane biogenesis lipoprotein LolB
MQQHKQKSSQLTSFQTPNKWQICEEGQRSQKLKLWQEEENIETMRLRRPET